VRIQPTDSFVKSYSAKERNSGHHATCQACQRGRYLLMALTSDRGLPCGFSHFSDLGDIIPARAAGSVGRIWTDMNVEINRAYE